MALSRRRWVLLFLIAGALIAFEIGSQYWAVHSEGYAFLVQSMKESPAIRQRVGDVREVGINTFGGFREKFVGSSEWTTITLDVTGSKGVVTVKASAQKHNGVWVVSDATIDGQRIELD
jgi:hypothetical protein